MELFILNNMTNRPKSRSVRVWHSPQEIWISSYSTLVKINQQTKKATKGSIVLFFPKLSCRAAAGSLFSPFTCRFSTRQQHAVKETTRAWCHRHPGGASLFLQLVPICWHLHAVRWVSGQNQTIQGKKNGSPNTRGTSCLQQRYTFTVSGLPYFCKSC